MVAPSSLCTAALRDHLDDAQPAPGESSAGKDAPHQNIRENGPAGGACARSRAVGGPISAQDRAGRPRRFPTPEEDAPLLSQFPAPIAISRTKRKIPTPNGVSHINNKRPTPECELPTPKWRRRIRPTPITNAPHQMGQRQLPTSKRKVHTKKKIPTPESKLPIPKTNSPHQRDDALVIRQRANTPHPNPLNQSVDCRLLKQAWSGDT